MTASITAKAVVVWHLRRTPDQEVWCLATDADHRFTLTVPCDPEDPTRLVAERHADIASLMRRADQVKQEFLGRGWREPEQREHGSKAYGRLTLVHSSSSIDPETTATPFNEHRPQD